MNKCSKSWPVWKKALFYLGIIVLGFGITYLLAQVEEPQSVWLMGMVGL